MDRNRRDGRRIGQPQFPGLDTTLGIQVEGPADGQVEPER